MSDKFKYEKRMIGFLIGYYYKLSTYSTNDFLSGKDEYFEKVCTNCNRCNKPDRICSKNTFYRLINDYVVSNDCIYHRLATKIGKNVILDRYDIYEKLESYQKLLVDNLIDFSKTNLEKLETSLILELKEYRNTLYISEILTLYLNLIRDRLNPRFSPKKEDIHGFLFLKDKVNESNRKIILYYFCVGIFVRGNYGIDLEKVSQECKAYLEDPLFYENKLECVYYMDQITAYNYLVNEELPKEDSLTSYHKYWLYRTFQIVQVNSSSYLEAYKSMLKCYEIINHSDFSEKIIWGCYLRLGFVSYCLGEYNQTVDWLMKAFEIRANLSKNLVFLCSSLEKLDKVDEINKLLNKTDFNNMTAPYGKKVYTYYRLKHQKQIKTKKDLIELENYICNILKPYFDTYGQIHKDVFNEDLKEYVKITGNYKKYYDFNC